MSRFLSVIRHAAGAPLAILLIALQAACGTGPTQPTPPQPMAPPPLAEYAVVGNVWDNVHRPIPEAVVEVIAGARPGVSAVTDEAGRYVLPGVFSGTIEVRASKAGYTAQTRTYPFSPGSTSPPDLAFELDTRSAHMIGEYSLTIAADPACRDLPPVARARTYHATFLPGQFGPNSYLVRFSGAAFFPDGFLMSVRVAGDRARFDLNPFDPETIAERLTDTTALGIWGTAQATVNPAGLSTPFNGTVEYCEQAAPQQAFPFYRCAVPPIDCVSSGHTLSLTQLF